MKLKKKPMTKNRKLTTGEKKLILESAEQCKEVFGAIKISYLESITGLDKDLIEEYLKSLSKDYEY